MYMYLVPHRGAYATFDVRACTFAFDEPIVSATNTLIMILFGR
jgi:hypothetical protein